MYIFSLARGENKLGVLWLKGRKLKGITRQFYVFGSIIKSETIIFFLQAADCLPDVEILNNS